MSTILWVLISFISGSIPFSFLLGKIILHTDIRKYGDGNPGAFNAWKAGKAKIGLPALLLDFLKGVIPVMIAVRVVGITGWGVIAVALAPIIGHAFSPFMKFHGGKAVAVTFGIWTALTLWQGPTIIGTFLGISSTLKIADAWSVIISMLGLLIFLIFYYSISGFDQFTFFIWTGNIMILAYKHRDEFKKGFRRKSK
ncbi:TPA: hypothetical protein ENS27_01350 [bacterium]|nr:hypothetical protein [bacterium]